ncbi:RecB family exonuclease [Rathayibacter rathayi]|uniref:RecB family exonuclease n=1 Tax=Rathayibacter rathayi TaxID=33887 RepID=UPI0015E41BBB|nr:PD-(D/E)XK nuclease family protein [Rathayibacter rathayi]
MSTSPHLEGAAWHGAQLLVTDPDKLRRIRRRQLSHSVAENFLKCPASAVGDTLIPRPSDPFAPSEVGVGAHSALEFVYEHEPSDRTQDLARERVVELAAEEWTIERIYDARGDVRPIIIKAVTKPDGTVNLDDTAALERVNDEMKVKWTARVTALALGDWDIEDPTMVDVHSIELDIQNVVINGVPARAFVDRIDQVPRLDGSGTALAVRDYKSGAYKPHNPRFGDANGDQQRRYAALVAELVGEFPVDARLLYIGAGKSRVIDLSTGPVAQALASFKEAWDTMNDSADTGAFDATPSNLCGWCPLVNSCPIPKLTSDKAKAHAETLPSKAALGIPVVPVGPAAAPALAPAAAKYPVPVPGAEQLPNAPRIEAAEHLTPPEKAASMTNDTTPTLAKYPASEYAAMAAFSLVDTATEHLNERGQALTPTTMTAFAQTLAHVLTDTEQTLFNAVGWEFGRHARLGFALASNLRLRPAPFGQDAADWAAWVTLQKNLLQAKTSIALGLLDYQAFPVDAFAVFIPAAPAAVAAA